jgi:hypothetical protein
MLISPSRSARTWHDGEHNVGGRVDSKRGEECLWDDDDVQTPRQQEGEEAGCTSSREAQARRRDLVGKARKISPAERRVTEVDSGGGENSVLRHPLSLDRWMVLNGRYALTAE